jgi:transcriptional regulator with XRE-family HTH domain
LTRSLGENMNKTIGEKIKQLRLEMKLSQEALAKDLYFSNRTISNWENNLREVSIGNLTKIATYFNVPITFFTEQQGILPVNGDSKKVFQEIKSKIIAIKNRDFYFLMSALGANVLLTFIPFANRLNVTVFIMFLWTAYLIQTIVRYSNLDRSRIKIFLVPLGIEVFYQSTFSDQNRKQYRRVNLLYYVTLLFFALIYYAGNFTMINQVDENIVFTSLVVIFTLLATFLHVIAILQTLMQGIPSARLPYLKDRIDLGMLLHRVIVTGHYMMIIFLTLLVSAYGHELFPFELLIFNLFLGIFLFILLRIILNLNSKFYHSYVLFSKNENTKTSEILS